MNIAALVATLIINALSQIIPFNNQTAADIANRIPLFFLPANFTFSIWGVIYTGLIAFTLYQALPSQKENPLVKRIGWWFVVTAIGNSTWLFLFHYNQFALSMVPMVLLLVALLAIHLRLGIGRETVSARDHWLIHVPMSIYLGWISVATIANATYVLYDFGWTDPASGQLATFVMLAIGAALAAAMVFLRRTPAFAFVVVWAFYGIYARQIDVTNAVTAPPADLAANVAVVALGMSVAIVAALGLWVVLNRSTVLRPGKAAA